MKLTLNGHKECQCITALNHLPYLQVLDLFNFPAVEYISKDEYDDNVEGLVVKAFRDVDGLQWVTILHNDYVVLLEERPPHLQEIQVTNRGDHDVELIFQNWNGFHQRETARDTGQRHQREIARLRTGQVKTRPSPSPVFGSKNGRGQVCPVDHFIPNEGDRSNPSGD
ncbi:hypothetical protein FEM48_Zijuj05G0131800 [Ziziphus jujuba var. spinosa]|uniref:Uncharacterized protein n=1 Tax=Ziziphus jujuba var. spinosa TaxID=714518 RepID=A0A978VF09_ZIZJJ|nr:hypothetical protein FEM48_Zijuj05G0131800 [Ziziphus jujuba var. spinosa]